MDDNISTLHPAAGIFRAVIADELAMENNCFREDAARLQPLLEHVQKIEMIGLVDSDVPTTITEEEQDGEVINVISGPEWKTLVTVKLSDGAVEDDMGHYFDDDSETDRVLSIPVATDDLHLKNLGFFGGVMVNLADKTLGRFPQTIRSGRSGNICENALVHINDDDTAILTLFVSDDVCIRGELTGLTDDDIFEFREEDGAEPHMKFYIGRFLSSTPFGFRDDETRQQLQNSPIFKPTSIVMKLTPHIKHKLRLIASTEESAGWELDDTCPSEKLRVSTIAALGNNEHKSLLIENHTLKIQQDALMNIRDELLSVQLAHGNGLLGFSLEDGERTIDSEGKSVWAVQVEDKENSSMSVNSIKGMAIFQSRILVNKNNCWQLRPELIHGPDGIHGIRIPYSPTIEVLAYFDLGDRDEPETADILQNFGAKLQSAFFGVGLRYDDGSAVPSFPPTFKMTIQVVTFSMTSVKHVLKLAGINEELGLGGNETGEHTD